MPVSLANFTKWTATAVSTAVPAAEFVPTTLCWTTLVVCANAFAAAPGTIFLYHRNMHTADSLRDASFDVITAEEAIARGEACKGTRVCVMLESHELSRARSGPLRD